MMPPELWPGFTPVVDTSVFVGTWPFRCLPHRTVPALKAYLTARGVLQAWVAPVEAILYPDPMQANEPLLAEVAGDPFWVPVAVLDPTLPTWREDALACLGRGARAFKLTPNYHGYRLTDPVATEVAALAAETGALLCVQLRVMDERAHHPLMKVPGVPAADVVALAASYPQVRFLACGAYFAELRALRPAANVWAELSFVETGNTLRAAVTELGAERVVFGSHSPFFYFEAVAAKLVADPADVSPEVVEMVGRGNAAGMLGGS